MMVRPGTKFGWMAWALLALTQVATAETPRSAPSLDAAQAWPRVFFSAQQREDIVRRRLPPDLREPERATAIDTRTLPPPLFTLDGIARGQLGASAIINGSWYRHGDKLFNWVVQIEPNQVVLTGVDVPILKLKPGQSVRIDNGAVSESVPSRALKLGAATPAPAPSRP